MNSLKVLGWTTWGAMYFIELFLIVFHVRFLYSVSDNLAHIQAGRTNETQVARQKDIFNKFFAHQYNEDEYTMHFVHITASIIWWTMSSWQMVAWIRKKNLNLHRWNGRLCILAAVAQVITGSYAGMTTHLGPHVTASSMLIAPLFLICALQTYRYAKMKTADLHSLWAIRCFVMSHAIIVQRFFLIPLIVKNRMEIFVHGNDALFMESFGLSFWMAIFLCSFFTEPLAQLIHPYVNPLAKKND